MGINLPILGTPVGLWPPSGKTPRAAGARARGDRRPDAEDWPSRGKSGYGGATRAAKVPEPVIIRITRPYRSVEEYLEAEAETIDGRGMLLVDADPLPKNTPVRFVISIATGQQLIRAEGTARSYVPKSPESPGGLRIWFKRYGVATKEIIDRATAIRDRQQRSPSAAGAGSGQPAALDRLRSRQRRSFPPPSNRDELLGRLRARIRRADY